MEFQLTEIAKRIRELREILGLSAEEMAEVTDVPVEEYEAIEDGRSDFNFTFLYKCAGRLGVDLTELLTGEGPKLSGCTLVRSGEGLPIKRQAGLFYYNLAFVFRNRMAEPFLVTAPYYEDEQDQPIHTTTHKGQEMDYILTGQLKFYYNGHIQYLNPGDTVYYDSGKPHGMIACGGEACTFLAVVMAPPKENR